MVTNKKGRKRKDFVDPKTGKPVVGLTRRPDGRWRVIGTHQTFREDDVQKAIDRFRKLTKADDGSGITDVEFVRRWGQQPLSMTIDQWWIYAAKEILERPQWVAKKTGIERIGWFDDSTPPVPLPTIKELEDVWDKHYKATEQKRRVIDAWRDFKTTTTITDLRQITPKLCIDFRDNVHARKLAPKSEHNMFTRIRRLFTFVRSREVAPDALAKIIDALKRLTPSDTTVSLDPHPISREDFTALLDSANADGKAMLYLMLNGAYSITEVIRLKWSDVRKDGTIITHRRKQGKCIRVCVLWKETIDAMSKVARRGEVIFMSREGLKLTTSGADKRFRKIRIDAGLPRGITSSHLRDGAFTAAVAVNVNERLCNLLAGHRCGMSDHYVKRNPKMVAPACLAVYEAYFGTPSPALKVA